MLDGKYNTISKKVEICRLGAHGKVEEFTLCILPSWVSFWSLEIRTQIVAGVSLKSPSWSYVSNKKEKDH